MGKGRVATFSTVLSGVGDKKLDVRCTAQGKMFIMHIIAEMKITEKP